LTENDGNAVYCAKTAGGDIPMDWSRIVWEKVFETRLWVIINLLTPLCIIPIAVSCAWLRKDKFKLMKILRDGQLCFYAIAITAASGYEVKEHWSQPYIAGMLGVVIGIGGLAILYFGLIFADGDGTVGHQRRFDDARVVFLSSFIATTSAFVAWVTHALVEGAYK
jgi:hypothetical protein